MPCFKFTVIVLWNFLKYLVRCCQVSSRCIWEKSNKQKNWEKFRRFHLLLGKNGGGWHRGEIDPLCQSFLNIYLGAFASDLLLGLWLTVFRVAPLFWFANINRFKNVSERLFSVSFAFHHGNVAKVGKSVLLSKVSSRFEQSVAIAEERLG